MPTVRKTHLEPSRIAPDTFLVHDHAGEGQVLSSFRSTRW